MGRREKEIFSLLEKKYYFTIQTKANQKEYLENFTSTFKVSSTIYLPSYLLRPHNTLETPIPKTRKQQSFCDASRFSPSPSTPRQKWVQAHLPTSGGVDRSSASTTFLGACRCLVQSQKNITAFPAEMDGLPAHLSREILHKEMHRPDISND